MWHLYCRLSSIHACFYTSWEFPSSDTMWQLLESGLSRQPTCSCIGLFRINYANKRLILVMCTHVIGWKVSAADDVRAVLGDFEWSFLAVTSQSYSADVTGFRLVTSECVSVEPTRFTCRNALVSLSSHSWLSGTAGQLRQVRRHANIACSFLSKFLVNFNCFSRS